MTFEFIAASSLEDLFYILRQKRGIYQKLYAINPASQIANAIGLTSTESALIQFLLLEIKERKKREIPKNDGKNANSKNCKNTYRIF